MKKVTVNMTYRTADKTSLQSVYDRLLKVFKRSSILSITISDDERIVVMNVDDLKTDPAEPA